MLTVLLIVIYIAFISLGLPDSVLGSAWPSMYPVLGAPVSGAGTLAMIIAAGTIMSSLLSDRLNKRLGTGLVTAVSVALTALALTGFSLSRSFGVLCLWAIPYGLGAGSVDAALNNFVALHYSSRHMSWLHCFWGVGATLGPAIMGWFLGRGIAWNAGYRTIGWIQWILVVGLIAALPLWRKIQPAKPAEAAQAGGGGVLSALALPGAKSILLAFFCYCSIEGTSGLWISSYMVLYRGLTPDAAASLTALFYLGITLGRFLSGFVANHLGDKRMIFLGIFLILAGVVTLLLPLGQAGLFSGVLLTGLGCAPVYPSLLHETPETFGAENSQAVMGLQMACAYIGSMLSPMLFGLIAQEISAGLLPVFLLILAGLMLVLILRSHRTRKIKKD